MFDYYISLLNVCISADKLIIIIQRSSDLASEFFIIALKARQKISFTLFKRGYNLGIMVTLLIFHRIHMYCHHEYCP